MIQPIVTFVTFGKEIELHFPKRRAYSCMLVLLIHTMKERPKKKEKRREKNEKYYYVLKASMKNYKNLKP